MRNAKEFLTQECGNLSAVLEETLRFKYGLEGSKEFFEECQARLKFLAGELTGTPETNFDALQKLSMLLSELAKLISRMERSSLGEYSWPFVEELKRIAVATCTEATLTDPKTPPQIFVLSGGGLGSYAIHVEVNRPSGSRMRIHSIVFPRTLKHFVLLHSILGHELGHAIWKCSQHQKAVRTIVNRELFSTGHFANPPATAAWLYANGAPAGVKKILAGLAGRGVTQGNFFGKIASWPAWIEEITCDFIGLVTFGPSFVAAESNLLYSCNPDGTLPGPQHPPVGCRGNYLLTGASVRGYDTDAFADATLKRAVEAFWTSMRGRRQIDPWFDVFTPDQIRNTANQLAVLMDTLPPASYPMPDERDLLLLVNQLARGVPPVGYEIGAGQAVSCRPIDFRHSLYAGWITAYTPPPEISFAEINRLCEHGIMQQRAIDMQLSASST